MQKMGAALLFPLAMAAVSARADERVGASGVAGTLMLSHTCRGPQTPDADCRAPFAQARLQLQTLSGKVAAQASSDAAGDFRMTAGSGRYRLHVVVDGAYPRCADVPVTIRRTQFAQMELECDSGMR